LAPSKGTGEEQRKRPNKGRGGEGKVGKRALSFGEERAIGEKKSHSLVMREPVIRSFRPVRGLQKIGLAHAKVTMGGEGQEERVNRRRDAVSQTRSNWGGNDVVFRKAVPEEKQRPGGKKGKVLERVEEVETLSQKHGGRIRHI